MTSRYSRAKCAELLALADKATPGPWTYDNDEENWHIQSEGDGTEIAIIYNSADFPCLDDAQDEESCDAECGANRALITSLPDLAAQLRAQGELLERAMEALKDLDNALCQGFDTKEDRNAARQALISARHALAEWERAK
jgi:hypothetical protein